MLFISEFIDIINKDGLSNITGKKVIQGITVEFLGTCDKLYRLTEELLTSKLLILII